MRPKDYTLKNGWHVAESWLNHTGCFAAQIQNPERSNAWYANNGTPLNQYKDAARWSKDVVETIGRALDLPDFAMEWIDDSGLVRVPVEERSKLCK